MMYKSELRSLRRELNFLRNERVEVKLNYLIFHLFYHTKITLNHWFWKNIKGINFREDLFSRIAFLWFREDLFSRIAKFW
jgi:hypothetical protein